MKVLITGGAGQLGRTLLEKLNPSYEVVCLPKEKLNIVKNQKIDSVFLEFSPDYVFHTAAYTAVDECEKNQAKAFQINSIGALNIAEACKRTNSKMIYISSDYVFDGKKETAYLEEDVPNPQSIYGLSKWLGEELVLKTLSECYVVRTSWLYGHGGNNFVNTMIKFASAQKEVNVVSDQIGSPTYVNDLADIILQLITKPYGIYHVSNNGQCSWYQFAKAIYEQVGTDSSLVKPITTNAYGAAAPRPEFSVLNNKKLESIGISMRHWNDALYDYLRKEGFHD